jgi:hypothetical protein
LDWVLLWSASFVLEASTWLPLFWSTSPPLSTATFGPLTTTGFELADWLALFEPLFDCSAACFVVPPAPLTVWV